MPYTPHALLTVFGHMGSGADAENWQFGIRVAQNDAGGARPLDDLTAYGQAISAGIISAWSSWSGTAAGNPAHWAGLDGWKVANIGANGKYLGSTDSHGGPNPYVSPAQGGGLGPGTDISVPWFLTLAVSFHSAAATKYARHGRIYAPLALSVGSTGSPRVSGTVQNAAVTWAKALLTNIAKPTGTGANTHPIRPVLASSHAGEVLEINEVRVGDVIDVQRRRKRQMRENYVKSAWS